MTFEFIDRSSVSHSRSLSRFLTKAKRNVVWAVLELLILLYLKSLFCKKMYSNKLTRMSKVHTQGRNMLPHDGLNLRASVDAAIPKYLIESPISLLILVEML
jgi:hypothetical protein